MIKIKELRKIETPPAVEGDPPIIKVAIRFYVKVEDEYVYQQISVDDFDIENSTDEQVNTIIEANTIEEDIKSIYKQRQRQRSKTYKPDGTSFKSDMVYKDWASGDSYSVNDLVDFNGSTYRCVQAHTVSDPTWTPEATAALWSPIVVFGDSIDVWQQPQGGHDAYPVDAIVSHNGSYYKALVGDNVWEPGTDNTLWVEVDSNGEVLPEPEVPSTSEWAAGVSYSVNDEVTYSGTTYSCLQAHTSQVGWEPPSVPSLWSAI